MINIILIKLKMNILDKYDKNALYHNDRLSRCTEFNMLMYIVINTNEYPELNNEIKNYTNIINDKNYAGYTALMLACRNINDTSSEETVEILLSLMCDVNIQDHNGETALMMACYRGHVNIVKLLLQYNVNTYLQDRYGRTCLMYIIDLNTRELLRLLLPYSTITHVNKSNCNVFYTMYDHVRLIASYCTEDELHALLEYKYYKEIQDELLKRYKLKIVNYERVLRKIPEQDSLIRFKPNNMGYQICQFDYDGIVTDALLDYLNATPDNVNDKVKEFLSFTCC